MRGTTRNGTAALRLSSDRPLAPLKRNGDDESGPPGDRTKKHSSWLLWQLVDSAFPTGGFAHSAGLEAAWQHGDIRTGKDLRSWLRASLAQMARGAVPFINPVHLDPLRLEEMDQMCDAFTSNHVANRASRAQGRALASVVARIFTDTSITAPVGHFAPVFGAVTSGLGIAHEEAVRLFIFQHMRGVVGAAVRLNIIGPMEGQTVQFQLGESAEELVQRAVAWTLDDLAQTSPLLEIWQGTQDRLYSRLFQS